MATAEHLRVGDEVNILEAVASGRAHVARDLPLTPDARWKEETASGATVVYEAMRVRVVCLDPAGTEVRILDATHKIITATTRSKVLPPGFDRFVGGAEDPLRADMERAGVSLLQQSPFGDRRRLAVVVGDRTQSFFAKEIE